ncbi:MAG: heme exporter protein CcmB [Methylococcus sp.]|nr:MAG: heme exporter protein CcmB [Methylococcus sp.]
MNDRSLARAFSLLLRRDLVINFRQRSECVNPVLFFVIVVTLFALGTGADRALLLSMAPGVIWVSALLASMLSLESIFRSDFEDGSLEQLLLSAHPVTVLVLAKVTAHWLVTGLPLILVAPLLCILLGLSGEGLETLILTLLIGTPILSLVGAIGVALTVGLRRGGVIISLLVLPLYIPVLIFGTSAVQMSAAGFPVNGQLSMLVALLALALALAPLPTAAALRMSLS